MQCSCNMYLTHTRISCQRTKESNELLKELQEKIKTKKGPFRRLLLQGRDEREFPFPTIFGNTGLRFPFPKFGNEFFIPVPVPKSWECNSPFPFPLPGMDYHVGNRMGIEFKSWDLGLLTDTIDPLDISLGYPWRIHYNKWKLGQQILWISYTVYSSTSGLLVV